MNVQSIHPALSTKSNFKSNPIAFKATPQQIIAATDTKEICGGKKAFLKNIAQFFIAAEEQLAKVSNAPTEFIYKLGEENNIPKSMTDIGIEKKLADGSTQFVKISDMDKELNKDGFRCSPTSTCNCGVGFSKGSYVTELLTLLGVEKPDEISITNKVFNA